MTVRGSNSDERARRRVVVPDHVVFRAFASETVLLNLRSGQYHGLNPSGGRMFEVLRDTGSIPATVDAIAEETGHPAMDIQQDLLSLCDRLSERGLIELDDAAAGG